jgi:hypothetical protein
MRDENAQLRADVARLNADLARVTASHAKLLAEAATRQAQATKPGAALGMPRHEKQRAILNNLRQIAAARDQYLLENSREPASINTLVGSLAYIRRVIPIDGEDYTSLSMQRGGVLTLTTVSGETITYDPEGGTTTKIDFPAAIVRAEELGQKLDPLIRKATEAYRLANQGKDPKNEQALLPFFATPQEGADFVEYIEAKKEARKY